MNLKKNTLVMGLGNCGGKITKLFSDLGYITMYVNGSAQDLKVLGNVKGIYKLKGYDGFGGHRERAMDCLCDNEEFTDALEKISQKIIVIIYSTGGSTGSGLSSVVVQYLKDFYEDEKIIVTVPVLPDENEAINKHKNTYQAVQELMSLNGIGASFFLDNSRCNNKDKDLNWINMSFVTMFDAFLTDDSWGEKNNFDKSERLEMLSEQGAMLISYAKVGINKLSTGNIFAPMQEDFVCGNIGIIHSEDNDVNIDDLIAEVGKPLNISEGYGGKCTLVAVSGATFPLDYVKKLGELAMEGQRERQNNLDTANVALPTLDFNETRRVVKQTAIPVKLTGRDALLARRKKSIS